MPASIFAGSKVKTLKDTLTLNGKSDIISSTVDPTASAVDAPIGSLLINQTSGKLYRKLDAGSSVNWEEVGAGVGGINYILNPSAEVNTTGWATYADAAGAAPVDGTGGSPNVTWTRSTTSPLRGVADFNFVKDAANRQGQGVSYDFTIDEADKAKVLSVTFDYEVLSGTYADGDLTVYLIADPTGTPVVIQPAGYTVSAATVGTTMREVATFQTQATGTSYRLCFHVASTSASAYTLAIDNVVVGPQQTVQGAAISDWVSYTPSWTSASNPQPAIGSGTVIGRYRRVGDSYAVQITIQGSSTGTVTTWGTGGYSFSLPAAADASKVSSVAAGIHVLGQASALKQATGWYSGSITFNGTGNAVSIYGPSATANLWGSASPVAWASNDIISIEFTYPVAGISSNTVMSQDTDTRVVAARITGTSTSLTASPTNQKISLTTVSVDKTGSWDSVNNRYVVPVSGIYKITGYNQINFGASNNIYEHTSTIRINTTLYSKDSGWVTTSAGFSGGRLSSNTEILDLKAGDTIELYGTQSSSAGGSRTPTDAGLLIERLSGPATIAASETVAMNRCSTGGQSIPSGVDSVPVSLSTSTIDTHGIWVNGTGYNSVTGTWTTRPRAVIPVSGTYLIQFHLGVGIPTTVIGVIWAQVRQWRSGSVVNVYAGNRLFFNNSSITSEAFSSSGSTQIPMLAGDEITLDFFQVTSPSANRTLNTEQRFGFLAITKVGY